MQFRQVVSSLWYSVVPLFWNPVDTSVSLELIVAGIRLIDFTTSTTLCCKKSILKVRTSLWFSWKQYARMRTQKFKRVPRFVFAFILRVVTIINMTIYHSSVSIVFRLGYWWNHRYGHCCWCGLTESPEKNESVSRSWLKSLYLFINVICLAHFFHNGFVCSMVTQIGLVSITTN